MNNINLRHDSQRSRLLHTHHAFSDLATKHPWLIPIECRVRQARPRDLAHLQRGFNAIHRVCQRLPVSDSIACHCHLGKLLDLAAEMHWSEYALSLIHI